MTPEEERRPDGNRAASGNPQANFGHDSTRPAEQSQQSSLPSLLEIALSYIRRGWACVPIPLGEKAPRLRAWNQLRLSEAQAPSYFDGPGNIGVILGGASGGLVDIDLDCSEAINLAPEYLPTTQAIFGRHSKPRSHSLYRVRGPAPSLKFADPVTRKMLVELRGDGGQTVFPGSTHPCGELIEWAVQGEPGTLEYEGPFEGCKRPSSSLPDQSVLSRSY